MLAGIGTRNREHTVIVVVQVKCNRELCNCVQGVSDKVGLSQAVAYEGRRAMASVRLQMEKNGENCRGAPHWQDASSLSLSLRALRLY